MQGVEPKKLSNDIFISTNKSSLKETQYPQTSLESAQFHQFNVHGELGKQTQELMAHFGDLYEDVTLSLEHSSRSPEELILALNAHIPTDCQDTSSWSDFMASLTPYITFFNYEMLEPISNWIGGEAQKKFEVYKEQFSLYCKNRITSMPFTSPKLTDRVEMMVKLDAEWRETTLEDLKLFQYQLAKILNVKQESLHLLSIQEGCVLLTYLVPSSFSQIILNNNQITDLKHGNVLKISVESNLIFVNLQKLLIEGCKNGDVEMVAHLLQSVDANFQQDGWTPLMYASYHGHLDVVKLLLDRNPESVNLKNSDGATPLMVACQNGRIDIVMILVVHLADINMKDLGGWTALMYACMSGYSNISQFLVEKGAKVNDKNEEGVSALHLACHHGHGKIVGILCEAGAQVDIVDQRKETPLMYACNAGRTDTVDILIKKGAYPSLSNLSGITPLMSAIENRFNEIVKTLLTAGACVSTAEPESKWTALFFAAKCGDLEIVKDLIHHGACVDVQDRKGITPLNVARVYEHTEVHEALQEQLTSSPLGTENYQNMQSQVCLTSEYLQRLLKPVNIMSKSSQDINT